MKGRLWRRGYEGFKRPKTVRVEVSEVWDGVLDIAGELVGYSAEGLAQVRNGMRLIHYSDKPLGKLESKTQGTPQTAADKPLGLWVSVGADWKRTAKECGWSWARTSVETPIRLKRGAKILKLTCGIEMHEFTEKYGVDCPFVKEHPRPFLEPVIDWRQVAKDYQGIIITPYQYACRMEPFTFWYYTWDCASGCIWDMEAVVSPLHD